MEDKCEKNSLIIPSGIPYCCLPGGCSSKAQGFSTIFGWIPISNPCRTISSPGQSRKRQLGLGFELKLPRSLPVSSSQQLPLVVLLSRKRAGGDRRFGGQQPDEPDDPRANRSRRTRWAEFSLNWDLSLTYGPKCSEEFPGTKPLRYRTEGSAVRFSRARIFEPTAQRYLD